MVDERMVLLNGVPPAGGRCVVYWMQRSQRAEASLALNEAIDRANDLGLPVICYFALDDAYPLGTERAYAFLLQGLADLAPGLVARNVTFVVRREGTVDGIIRLAREVHPALVVTDDSHLRFGRRRRAQAGRGLTELGVALLVVDNDLLVPVRTLGRAHSAARTIRPHLQGLRDTYLHPIPEPTARHRAGFGLDLLDLGTLPDLLSVLTIDRAVPAVPWVPGGRAAGLARLRAFLCTGLEGYIDDRNNAALDATSGISPYLHFGQLDPWTVGLEVQRAGVPPQTRTAFLEELLVRRELASNFTVYNSRYDSFDGIPAWAQETLRAHQADAREATYSVKDLEMGATHDPLWNAAQRELLHTGGIHNYMRMYWGKQVITWTHDPRTAFDWTLYLNNRYALDGRDPVSFANVAWCYGVHDRPWPSRPIFGTVRSMTAGGARRKFNVDAYIARVDAPAGK
jgi:deoxyribodipyrimidine photo-lyase